MLKIAITAGHHKYTTGKRIPKELDKNETREWTLNARIAEKVEQKLKAYEGYELLRTDDRTGEKGISNDERIAKANRFDADIYLSIHHNAGINGGKGGGIVAYTYTRVDQITKEWQKELYDALIKHTGLKGNRAKPLSTGDYQVLRETKMPAVLLELGFMDSATDAPIILSEEFADSCAEAITEVLVKRCGLKTKPEEVRYIVQTGAFSKRENAEKQVAELKIKGFEAIIKQIGGN